MPRKAPCIGQLNMTLYLLTPDPLNHQVEAIETTLRDLIPELRKIRSVDEIAAELNGKGPKPNQKGSSGEIAGKTAGKIIVIFLAPSLATTGIDNLINIARRYRDKVFFILVSNEISATDYKRLINSGGADWVGAGSPLQEIPEIIYRQNARPGMETGASAKAKPTVVSFLPSMGGVGNTTIALEVALHIKLAKASRSWKVCYVDLDFQTSHVCDYLDIEARLQIHELFDQPERLDQQLFDLFVSSHASGLDVFAAPRNKADPCAVNVDALDALMEMILEKYDFVVLDLPVAWFNWTPPILENSDAVIVVGVNTIPCLRQMRSTLDTALTVKVPASKLAVVMNRVTRGLLGGIARRRHVDSIINEKSAFFVREDPLAIERVNTGTPSALENAVRAAKNFGKLAQFCASLRRGAPRDARK